jgi:hypothetical protein
MSEDADKDAQMAELKAQVKAQALELEKFKRQFEAQQNQPRPNTPIGSPLEGTLGPTAKLAIDRATRPPDRDQLDLVRIVGTDGRR